MEELHLTKLKINLQLFAEKTEKPTAKRQQRAAQKGQVAQSPEINSVVVLVIAFLIIRALMPFMIQEWTSLTDRLYQMFAKGSFVLDYQAIQEMFILVLVSSSKIVAPVAGGVMLGGLTASVIQGGLRFDMSAVAFNMDHINPVSGFKRIFSPQSLAELVKSCAKVALVGYICYAEYMKEFYNFARLSDMNLRSSSSYIGQVTMNVVLKVILWLVILAVADYLFLRWRTQKQIMMSKEEVKQEYKETEGDPQLKGKIKAKQRQMSMSRMMQVLPKADVVITNPTHFAVALQYDSTVMNAPLVLAKGQDRMALKIKEIAKEHNIVIVENKPLAQSLYHSTEIGDAVPAELFQAVAEVLAFVYKLKGKI